MPAHCIPRAADRATAVRCCCVVAIRCVLRGDVAAMVNGIDESRLARNNR